MDAATPLRVRQLSCHLSIGAMLQEKCKATGVACELVHPHAVGVKHVKMEDYLIAKLSSKEQ